MVGRVGNRYVWQGEQTENQGGQTKFFSALRAEFYQKCLPTLAWNSAGAPDITVYGHAPTRRPPNPRNYECRNNFRPQQDLSDPKHNCNLKDRPHNRQLPDRMSHLTNCNFIVRKLFWHYYWLYWLYSLFIVLYFIGACLLTIRSDSCSIKETFDYCSQTVGIFARSKIQSNVAGDESSRWWKFQGTKVSWNFPPRERKFHPMELSSQGMKVLGDDSSYRNDPECPVPQYLKSNIKFLTIYIITICDIL